MSVFHRISKLLSNTVKLKPQKVYVGKDFDGNYYYEVPPQRYFLGLLSHTQRNRVVEPPTGITSSFYGRDAHALKVTHEWDSWLRKKRDDPPTLEEISKNIVKYNQVQMRIAALEKLESKQSTYSTKPSSKIGQNPENSKSKDTQSVDSWMG